MLTPPDCCMWVALLHQPAQLVCFDTSKNRSGTIESLGSVVYFWRKASTNGNLLKPE
jgi:hypothetical protein